MQKGVGVEKEVARNLENKKEEETLLSQNNKKGTEEKHFGIQFMSP